jgi:type I site-specific restriction endonuclease
LLRKRYIVLTPEEWVRQHFIQFLISEKNYPVSLMSVEKGLKLNTRQKRTDIVVFSNFGNPWMIVECKSPMVKITEVTLFQAARYNMSLNVQFISLTNGMEHYCCKIGEGKIEFLEDLPAYL